MSEQDASDVDNHSFEEAGNSVHGRPTKYRPEYCAVAREMCERGATNADLALKFGVALSTVWVWQTTHAEFFESCKLGRKAADDRVEHSFFMRATGYDYVAEKIMSYDGTVVRAQYTEHAPPDPAAIRFWLINRRPKEWKDISKVNHDGEARKTLNALHDAITDYRPVFEGGGVTPSPLDWVIVGVRRGHSTRLMHPDWTRLLRDEYAESSLPYLFKQWGEWWESDSDTRDGSGNHYLVDEQTLSEGFDRKADYLISPDGRVFRDWNAIPEGVLRRWMTRLGKNAAGRLLDGVEHNGMPRQCPPANPPCPQHHPCSRRPMRRTSLACRSEPWPSTPDTERFPTSISVVARSASVSGMILRTWSGSRNAAGGQVHGAHQKGRNLPLRLPSSRCTISRLDWREIKARGQAGRGRQTAGRKSAGRPGAGAARRPMTISSALDRFWIEVGESYTGTYRTTVYSALAWMTKEFGANTPLRDIGPNRITQAIARRRGEMVQNRKSGEKVKNSTVNRTVVELLRRVLRRARLKWEQRDLPDIDWKEQRLSEPKERVRELRDQEEPKLIATMRSDYLPAIRFALATGLRKRELVGLRWRDIDWGAKTISVLGKGGKVDTIPLTRGMIAILAPLRGHHDDFVFTYLAKKTRDGRRKGSRYPMTYAGLSSAWRRFGPREAGIEDFRYHDLRHTAGTRLLRGSGNLRLVQKLLRHEDIATTTKYAHADDHDLRRAMEAVESPLSQPPHQSQPEEKKA